MALALERCCAQGKKDLPVLPEGYMESPCTVCRVFAPEIHTSAGFSENPPIAAMASMGPGQATGPSGISLLFEVLSKCPENGVRSKGGVILPIPLRPVS